MKKLLLCTLAGIMIFTGCAPSGDVVVGENHNKRFQKTGNVYSISQRYWYEYVDTETNNLYVVSPASYGGGYHHYMMKMGTLQNIIGKILLLNVKRYRRNDNGSWE